MLIQSRENPKIKLYGRLRDKKSAREREGMFVIEGGRIISDALKENVTLISAFYTASARERYTNEVAELCSRLGDDAFEVTEEVSQKLAETIAPQGIYAIAQRLDKTPPLDKIVYGGKYLILNSLQDPGNVGTILRAADAVGISGVYLCNSCDIYNPKLVRSTMGSLFRVPLTDCLGYSDVLSLLKSAGISSYAAVVDKDASSLREFEFPESCAVVIGNEGSGLTHEDAMLCDGRITIKMSGTIESLNAASAATIFLWELTKQRKDDSL